MADPEPARRKHKTQRPPLSAREIRFCQHYAERGNGYQSYLDAGFPERETRQATDQAVKRLVRKRQIREHVRQLQDAAADAAKLYVETIAQGLYRDAFADRRKLFGPDGEMLPPHLWPDDVAATVQGIECEELEEKDPKTGKRVKIGYKWKVKTTDRLKARQIAAQWRRMIGDDKDAGKAPPAPLVVGGEASPGNL